jgi:hypothetical protein
MSFASRSLNPTIFESVNNCCDVGHSSLRWAGASRLKRAMPKISWAKGVMTVTALIP